MKKTRIVILGGGFGGIYTALELDKSLARNPNVEVTLINKENFFLFTPMLHEVAASDLDVTHIVNPIRKMLKHVRLFNGDVEFVDMNRKIVVVSHGDESHSHEIEYDHLVFGLGSITNFFGIPGLADRALTMKTLGDAIDLRNRMIEHLEEADFECSIGVREHLLTFVVAGGGFAGVETVAGMNDFLREASEFYSHLGEQDIRVVLVHPGEIILPELGPKLGSYAQEKLAERGVEIHVKKRVAGLSGRGVELNDGTIIPSKILIWTAGTSSNPLIQSLPCNMEHGKVVVDRYMEVPMWPGVWALGDCAYVLDPKSGKPYPPTAQHALRQGKVLARNILASIEGGKKKEFQFSTLGLLASIGRRAGVANILGVNFSGFVAWWLWRTIYLSKLPRAEKKLRVMLDWTLDLIFSKDLVQLPTFRSTASSVAGQEQAKERVGQVRTAKTMTSPVGV